MEYINEITGQKYFILGANALKLNESIDLFYFANRIKPLKHAVFTLNFNEFNEYAFADRVTSVEAMIHNPLLYVFDGSVAQAGYYVVKSSLTKQRAVSSVPPMSEDAGGTTSSPFAAGNITSVFAIPWPCMGGCRR